MCLLGAPATLHLENLNENGHTVTASELSLKTDEKRVSNDLNLDPPKEYVLGQCSSVVYCFSCNTGHGQSSS